MSTTKDEVCRVCGSADDGARMLLCDGCDSGYHTTCLSPPLVDIPKEDWYCASCAELRCSGSGKTKTLKKGKQKNAEEAHAYDTQDDNDAHILTDNLDRELTNQSLEDVFALKEENLPASVRLERAVYDIVAEQRNAEVSRITALIEESFERFLKEFSMAAQNLKKGIEYIEK